jgi:glycosyltransferase involved in cell wall biosynthesis
MRLAIITEFLSFKGGIEKCILLLHNELSSRGITADIYAGLYEADKTFKEFKKIRVNYIAKNKFPAILNSLYLRYKFSRLNIEGYDGYIIFGSHSIAAAKNHHPNILWSTRPLAYLYGFDGRVKDSEILYLHSNNPFKKIIIKSYLSILRIIDQNQIKYIDKIMAVGPLARKWLLKAYPNRKVEVLYQPVELSNYNYISKGEFYINVARHVRDKYVDRVIEAFKKMPDKRLIQVGEGENTEFIKKIADGCKNIHLAGFLKEKDLQNLIGKSIAMISASENEDFSMNLIESIAAGKPTISTNTDRSKKELIKTDTGILMPNSRPESIIGAVNLLDIKQSMKMKNSCINKSRLFSVKHYADNLLKGLGLELKC